MTPLEKMLLQQLEKLTNAFERQISETAKERESTVRQFALLSQSVQTLSEDVKRLSDELDSLGDVSENGK